MSDIRFILLYFATPITGFVLGLLFAIFLFRQFPSIQNFFLNRQTPTVLTESTPLLHNEMFRCSQSTVNKFQTTVIHDIEGGLQNDSSVPRPAVLYYKQEEKAILDTPPAYSVVDRASSSMTGSLISLGSIPTPQPLALPMPLIKTLLPSENVVMATPSLNSNKVKEQQHNLSSDYPGSTNKLLNMISRTLQSMIQQQFQDALSSSIKPTWMENIELIPSVPPQSEETQVTPQESVSTPAITECTMDQDPPIVLLKVSWRPLQKARLRVTKSSDKGLGNNKGTSDGSSSSTFDILLVSMKINAGIRLQVGQDSASRDSSCPQEPCLRLTRPLHIDLDLLPSSYNQVSSSDEGVTLSLLKQWLINVICSDIFGVDTCHEDLTTTSEEGLTDNILTMKQSQDEFLGTVHQIRSMPDVTEPSPMADVTEPSPILPDEIPNSPGSTLAMLGRSMSRYNSLGTKSIGIHESFGPSVVLDLEAVRKLATMKSEVWEGIHLPGKAAPFNVRGPNYLKDRIKIPAGLSAFTLSAFDMVALPHSVEHVARFLPSVRESGAPFALVINLIIPGNPLLSLVATFVTDRDCFAFAKSPLPQNLELGGHGWSPFDLTLHRFMNGDDNTRNKMLKLIPHIDSGNWVVRNAVGTKPVIVGTKLKTTYHKTEQYIEIDIDVSANSTAAMITGMVRGATSSLVIDLGFVLESQFTWELPEVLIGAARVSHLNVKDAQLLNIDKELPLLRAGNKRNTDL